MSITWQGRDRGRAEEPGPPGASCIIWDKCYIVQYIDNYVIEHIVYTSKSCM